MKFAILLTLSLGAPALANDKDKACEEKYAEALKKCDTDPIPAEHHKSMGFNTPEEMKKNEANMRATCRLMNEAAIGSCKREK